MDKPHKKLEVWQKSMGFVVEVYKATATFPSEEKYGLISQMCRAAVSIPSNLAEGAARGTNELIQFARIAIGSASELDTQLELSRRLGYLSREEHGSLDENLAQIDRMLIGLRKSLLRKQGRKS